MAEIKNEWTVMYFFAGDKALSPLIVSQVKAIKDAGFQEHTDVLVHFDSNAQGAPTRLYEVNRERKKNSHRPTMIGDGNDPFVRNMFEDNVDPASIDEGVGPTSAAIKQALQKPNEVNAKDGLTNFLGYCRENHRAKHYLLFLVGHGLIVGNDTFLPDDVPASAITLRELDEVLGDFSGQAGKEGGAFELLAMHSCSMSALEVAYQLRGTANYLMASEGTSYVGSWPYRQLMKKLFNTVESARQAGAGASPDVPTLMSKLYYLAMYNATDYMLSGYSLDLALCSLAEEKFDRFKEPFQRLIAALRRALSDGRGKEIVQLAHLESQSYWQENYTDLFDLCECLRRKCDDNDDLQRLIKEACDGLIGKTDKGAGPFSDLVVHSDNFGSKYQFSHGLSIYFPWCEPSDDEPRQIRGATAEGGAQQGTEEETPNSPMGRYRKYDFTTDFGDNSWYSFLKDYFRATRREEAEKDGGKFMLADLVPVVFNPFGALGPGGDKETGSYSKETGGYGFGCDCACLKNYPTKPVTIKGEEKSVRVPSISEGLIDAFQ
jgi:hypothetical protein